jgi:hypothetical protein
VIETSLGWNGVDIYFENLLAECPPNIHDTRQGYLNQIAS